jgi:hypothetical protein
VRFIEHQAGPPPAAKRVHVFAENVVIDDHPVRIAERGRALFDDVRRGVRRGYADLARPVALD